MSAYGDETERSSAMLFLSTLNAVTDVWALCVAAMCPTEQETLCSESV